MKIVLYSSCVLAQSGLQEIKSSHLAPIAAEILCGGDSKKQRLERIAGEIVLWKCGFCCKKKAALLGTAFDLVCYYYYLIISKLRFTKAVKASPLSKF